MAKAPVKKDLTSLSYDEIVKAIKAMSKSTTFIGDSEITEICSIPKISTGIPTLDYLLGGGITKGRITILAGNPSAGKSTLTLQIISKLIEEIKVSGANKFILVYDVEGSWEAKYAKALGVDQKYVMIKRTSVMEDAFKEIDDYISMGFIAALIIDSLDSMMPRKQDDNAYQATMGGASGALAAHLPNLYSKIIEHEVTSIIIKQARVKLDAFGAKGEVITFSGGKAIRHYSDTILIMKRLSNRNLTYTPIQIKAEKTRSSKMGLTLMIWLPYMV